MALLNSRYPNHNVTVCNNPFDAVRHADIVYTDVWASMRQEDDAERRKAAFAAFQVNSDLMTAAPRSADARFFQPWMTRRVKAQPLLRGTMISASPVRTALPPTSQTVSIVTRALSASMAVMVARAVT